MMSKDFLPVLLHVKILKVRFHCPDPVRYPQLEINYVKSVPPSRLLNPGIQRQLFARISFHHKHEQPGLIDCESFNRMRKSMPLSQGRRFHLSLPLCTHLNQIQDLVAEFRTITGYPGKDISRRSSKLILTMRRRLPICERVRRGSLKYGPV